MVSWNFQLTGVRVKNLDDHPTVRAVRARQETPAGPVLDAEALRETCRAAGADDVGFVAVDDPAVAADRERAGWVLPGARTYLAFVLRMNPDSVRSPARSIANTEFHQTGEDVDRVARRIAAAVRDLGHRALNPPATFPQEMEHFGRQAWVIQLKTVAVAAGLGAMGIHRNVIHPRFGNFVLLGVVLTDAAVSEPTTPLTYNPCLECKLCVSACPVGAIGKDGSFDLGACYTHNYREFMTGFTDLLQTVADSADAADFRSRVSDTEALSWWQSLAYKPNYKAAYCMAACPAGEDVIGPYLDDRKEFRDRVVTPLRDKVEPVYVQPGSSAESYTSSRFPHKRVRHVDNGIRRPARKESIVDQ